MRSFPNVICNLHFLISMRDWSVDFIHIAWHDIISTLKSTNGKSLSLSFATGSNFGFSNYISPMMHLGLNMDKI